MSTFIKACIVAASIVLTIPNATALAASGAKTEKASAFPTAFKKTETNRIKYDDLDLLLKQTILQTGRSNHKPASKPAIITGTRVSYGNSKPSRLEGNRALFHQQTDELQRVSKALRDTMLAMPERIDFSTLSKNEQLAFWLNLHNIIVYQEIATRYPITDLRPVMGGCEGKKSIYCQQKYTLSGKSISLQDIRDHIIQNWNDPLVIYGFYLGAVGTPNARAGAFTGENVWRGLHENAVDFIHSVRGTRLRSGKRLAVSEYYSRFSTYFPDFEKNLLTHIKEYAEPAYAAKLDNVKKLQATINDWNIADLYNGHLKDPTGAGNVRRVDPRSARGVNPIPLHAQRLLTDIQDRNNKRDAKARNGAKSR